MKCKAGNQLTLLQCFCSASSEPSISPHSTSRAQLDRSYRSRSRSASPESSVGSQADISSSSQVNRPIHESICDDRAPNSPISISSNSCNSETSRGCDEDPGQFDAELLLGSGDSCTADACEIAENFVQPGNSDLPSASHSSLVDRTEDPSDIAQTPAFPPVRPRINRFPTTMFGSKARSFNPLWFKSYDWLEYSVKMDACFCYPCRMFGAQGSQFGSRPESTFTVTGFRDWKHATGKNGVLNGHARCFSHKQEQAAWGQYKLNCSLGTTLPNRLGNNYTEAVQQNRHYLEAIAEVILVC